jgi:hypothetical protein
MKIKRSLLKRIIHEELSYVLEEASGPPDISGLAVHLPKLHNDYVTAIIYDTDALVQNLENIKNIISDNPDFVKRTFAISNFLVDHVLKGFLEAGIPRKRDGKCNGAWQVYKSVAPGYGKVLYSVGYALSPNGQLFPDRGTVSSDAQNAWTKVFGGSRERKPFDDIDHIHNDADDYHTDDPADDCTVWRAKGTKYLNYSYESEGWERGILSQLRASHEETMSKVKQLALDSGYIERILEGSGSSFFAKHYKSDGILINDS